MLAEILAVAQPIVSIGTSIFSFLGLKKGAGGGDAEYEQNVQREQNTMYGNFQNYEQQIDDKQSSEYQKLLNIFKEEYEKIAPRDQYHDQARFSDRAAAVVQAYTEKKKTQEAQNIKSQEDAQQYDPNLKKELDIVKDYVYSEGSNAYANFLKDESTRKAYTGIAAAFGVILILILINKR